MSDKDWRKSREYRLWRVAVIRRDKRCIICNSIKSRHAHHINHATYFIDQRFDVDNGVCLCSKCHMNYHCNFHRSYREKCTKYDLDNFIKLVNYFWVFNKGHILGVIRDMVDGLDDLP